MLNRLTYLAFVCAIFALSMFFLFLGLTHSDWHDFDVFYFAAKAALNGNSIYIVVGKYNLPFWYFPWTAWFYIPFAILPKEFALIIYQSITIISAVAVVNSLTHSYSLHLQVIDKLLMLSLLGLMSLQVFIVGQMEYILLGLIVITMYAVENKRDILAGLLLPILWTKPHLLIIFTLFIFWRAGKRALGVSIIASVLMLGIQTLLNPGWHLEMLNLLKAGQQRKDGLEFMTLPSLFGLRENWVGTANLPFTIVLIILAFAVVWKYRALPSMPLLSLALTASLFCAPRAYAYDLPLLIPGLIWITEKNFKSSLLIWLCATLFPPLMRFSAESYLVVIMVFFSGIYKAHTTYHLPRRSTDTI
jgi:hypothetical protein